MTWKTGNQLDHDKRSHIPLVINFISQLLLIGDNTDGVVKGFTEHNRELNGTSYKFRAHPSYRSDSGQKNGLWYDWAYFIYEQGQGSTAEDSDTTPTTAETVAQILCFIEYDGDHPDYHPGLYAVVRSFKAPPTKCRKSNILYKGEVEDQLNLFSCESINGPAAVVPNHDALDESTQNKFFVVKNRSHWLKTFHKQVKEIEP